MKTFIQLAALLGLWRGKGYDIPEFRDCGKYADVIDVAAVEPMELVKCRTASAAALRFVSDHRPGPQWMQFGETEFEMDFAYWDGRNRLRFFASRVGVITESPVHFDLDRVNYYSTAHPHVTEAGTDRARFALLYWAMANAARWSPDEKIMTTLPAGRSLLYGKSISVPQVIAFRLPADHAELEGLALRAKSNLETIKRMSHQFERTTITDEAGNSRPGYAIACTRCTNSDSVVASGHTGSLPQDVIAKKFRQKGWQIAKKCVCPTCLNPEPKPVKTIDIAPVPPRQMTASDKRKVFRAIDDAWDESKGRYVGACSDTSIAGTLEVPRIWVAQIREENFGKTQRNEDIDKMTGELKNLRGEIARHANTAMELAAKFEAIEQQITLLQARVESVE